MTNFDAKPGKMLIGHARASTAGQDLALQTDALNKAGCGKRFTDKGSGAKADRPGLAEALHFARAGDYIVVWYIVVWKLDRLGRPIQGLIVLAADLSARKIDFRSLTDGFDTSTASRRLLFHILASVAEMERVLIKARTIAGLAAARQRGGIGSGRKSALTPDKIDTARKLLAAGQMSPPRSRGCYEPAYRPSTGTSRRVRGRTKQTQSDICLCQRVPISADIYRRLSAPSPRGDWPPRVPIREGNRSYMAINPTVVRYSPSAAFSPAETIAPT